MPVPHPSLIYWKWNDKEVGNLDFLRARIDELCRRSCFTHIYVSLVWCHETTDTALGRAAVAFATRELHARGRKILLDLDVRPCRDRFAKRFPHALQGICTTEIVTLDGEGRAAWTTGCDVSGDHYGRYELVDSRFLAAYAFLPAAPHQYQPGTLERIDAACAAHSPQPGALEVTVHAPDKAGHSVLLFAWHRHVYPDVFSDELIAFYDELAEHYRDLPLDGAAVDEWGLYPVPGWGFSGAWRCPWYSPGFEKFYRSRTGQSLLDGCVAMLLAPANDEPSRHRAIHDYYDAIRARNAWFEEYVYRTTKRHWGANAFVGVHPTWYAIDPILYSGVEVWKNGLHWWDTARDYGQTDEYAPYAVRAALARRCGGAVWYNMWYGMGGGDVRTFLREIRRGLRTGGRLHALGFDCPNESEVLTLCETEALDLISALIERVALLDRIQDAPVDAQVALVFGYETIVNWTLNVADGKHWDPTDSRFAEVFQLAIDLWDAGFACDLIPTSEIAAGRLQTDAQGRAVYAGHAYAQCVVVHAEFATSATCAWLSGLAPAHATLSAAPTRDRDGQALHPTAWSTLVQPFDVATSADVIGLLRARGIDPWPAWRGRMADGMHVWTTTDDDAPAGQPLEVRDTIDGHSVECDCEDYLALRLDAAGKPTHVAAPRVRRLLVDGQPVLPALWSGDLAWRTEEAKP